MNNPTVTLTTDTLQDNKESLEGGSKKYYGRCKVCGKLNTHKYWCVSCFAERFKQQSVNWTSGNKEIDEFILELQVNATNFYQFIEWIPYEKFSDVKYLSKGGYGEVFTAQWDEGYICGWLDEYKDWYRDSNIKVVLKSLLNSKNMTKEFLRELQFQVRSYDSSLALGIIRCYGITRDAKSGNFMMVMDYGSDGSLRKYLDIRFNNLIWYKKLNILLDIIKGIRNIHRVGMTHRDLHGGNIIVKRNYTYITDFGLSKLVEEEFSKEKKKIFGVLPFVAPEVLCQSDYTKAADIYSFGIIMNEMTTGIPPYNDVPHDGKLAFQIISGLRPKINKDRTPQLILDLIEQCWDKHPENRPTAETLHDIIEKMNVDCQVNYTQLYKQIQVINKFIKDQTKSNTTMSPIIYKTHPQAIYTSRLLLENKTFVANPANPADSSITGLILPDDSDDESY
ncbi:kinase-like domain-containing protein [Glomus cerebriforme]|uniref:Kinase-like domain-containing protein n=1 Tax=Glomus cerebriforme TaxID=658196 RepID=A0A397S8S2_9GLOM|nr:kinase-like domain-containing protein [Glomus cerebriforme]